MRQSPNNSQRGGIFWKVLSLFTVLLVIGVIYLLRAPLLREAARTFVVQDELRPSDVMIVLGDDNYPADRATRAAELFRERWAPVIVASGRYLRPYASIADLMQRDLMARGVPQSAIVHFPHFAASTREEAYAFRELAESRGWKHVLVVTSNYHTRRARYVFRDVLDEQFDVRVVSAADAGFDPRNWWESRDGRKIFLRETLAWPLAWWEARRDTAPSPGTPVTTPSEAPVR
jgi:uncharacterized SAM-binding protein YcdF (DUF218 family)